MNRAGLLPLLTCVVGAVLPFVHDDEMIRADASPDLAPMMDLFVGLNGPARNDRRDYAGCCGGLAKLFEPDPGSIFGRSQR